VKAKTHEHMTKNMTKKIISVASVKLDSIKKILFLLFAPLLIGRCLLAIASRGSSQRTLPHQRPVSSILTMQHSPVGIQSPKAPWSEDVARLNISVVYQAGQLA